MRVLVTGADGHLGTAIAAFFAARDEVTAATRADLDIGNHRAVAAVVERLRPAAIINCAAYTDVDGAEDQPVEALDVNAFAVRALASAARDVGATLVHYSTDFVFDGSAERPYAEDVRPNPRSTYACSKMIGEWFAREAGRYYVLRVESIFGAPPIEGSARRTSVDRIVDAIVSGQEARVFFDRTVSPSYNRDVAVATHALLERDVPHGLFHCVNSGSCTWAELASEVGRQLGIQPRLVPVRLSDAKLRAERPRYCALSNGKLAAAGVAMPTWQDALSRYLDVRRGFRGGLDTPGFLTEEP